MSGRIGIMVTVSICMISTISILFLVLSFFPNTAVYANAIFPICIVPISIIGLVSRCCQICCIGEDYRPNNIVPNIVDYEQNNQNNDPV